MSKIITCYTLIDITPTGVTRGQSSQRDQQRNWESVLQVLGLKTQPEIVRDPVCSGNEPAEDFEFGDFYLGLQTVWAFQFTSDRPDFYSIAQLEQDFDQVPIIMGLDETARFMLPIFLTSGALKNICFFDFDGLNIS
tara:strand:- start:1165 stop:1575 length:411 start_codon:yes stop_codon:yes gene_type:complete